jgi:hypothetical protein
MSSFWASEHLIDLVKRYEHEQHYPDKRNSTRSKRPIWVSQYITLPNYVTHKAANQRS